MHPFYIEPDSTAVKLYRLEDGRFQIIEQGNLTPVLSGYGYLLVEKDLADFLKELNMAQLTFKDAVICDRKDNKEYHSYKEVIPALHFSPEELNTLNLDGDQVYIMGNEHVFVSPMLKEKLEKSQFDYLKFSKGLVDFAGF